MTGSAYCIPSATTTTTASGIWFRRICGTHTPGAGPDHQLSRVPAQGLRKKSKASAANTRKLLGAARSDPPDPFVETPDQVAARVLRPFACRRARSCINDEAHHCYQDKLIEHPDPDGEKEDEERNARRPRLVQGASATSSGASGVKSDLRPLCHPVLPERFRLQRGDDIPMGRQ